MYVDHNLRFSESVHKSKNKVLNKKIKREYDAVFIRFILFPQEKIFKLQLRYCLIGSFRFYKVVAYSGANCCLRNK